MRAHVSEQRLGIPVIDTNPMMLTVQVTHVEPICQSWGEENSAKANPTHRTKVESSDMLLQTPLWAWQALQPLQLEGEIGRAHV